MKAAMIVHIPTMRALVRGESNKKRKMSSIS